MNVYIGDKNDIERLDISKVFDFVRPLLNRNKLSESELLRKYGTCYLSYNLVFNPEDADFCILPYSWNYYYDNNKINDVVAFIEECKRAQKEIVTVNLGDFGVKALVDDVIVFRQSGYQSKRLQKQFALSVFFTDPLKVFFEDRFEVREKKQKPLVGFCGQGEMSRVKYGAMFLITLYRNSMYYMGRSISEPQALYPSTLRRNIVLQNLSDSKIVDADFIIRTKYRGGARTKEEGLKTTMEFYNNIRNTDYTVAIRGGGNFSVRIYETLANGRIPLFINTDCVLPFDNQVNWKEHLVWVEESDVKYVDELLSDFHNEIHPDDFKQMQINNRKLWEEYLSFEGFYCHLKDVVKSSAKM